MKKKLTLLIVALFGVLSVSAQNGRLPAEVTEPGCKGALPTLPDLAPAREGELPILELGHVGYDTYYFGGGVYIAANLSFPMVSEVGCDYYTVQYRGHGNGAWATMMDGENPTTYSDRTVGTSPSITVSTDFRLCLHGGEKDGYVSNIVTATPPSFSSRYIGWTESPTIEHTMVGIPVGEQFSVTSRTYEDGNTTDYTTAEYPDYFTYQWYRRNPNNWDMEAIEGATGKVYTPTMDDLGYQLIIGVGGDKVHCDFTLLHPLSGVVCVPVLASVSYVGNDGFVLNTEYVIPEPQKMFTRMEYGYMEEPTLFDPSCVSQRAPGQYAFRTSMDEYNYRIFELTNPAYYLTFYYPMMGWYREVQIMGDAYLGSLGVKVEKDGQPVKTTVDVIGQNIDGKWVTVETLSTDGDVVYTSSNIFKRPYYLKANATDATQETFYPNAPTMSQAETVMPGESWNAPVFILEAQGKDNPGEGGDMWLVLWLKNGQYDVYHVATHPRIKHHDGDFLIISDEVDIAYPVADVRKFTLAKDITDFEDAIGSIPEDNQFDDFSMNRARPGSLVNIYDMSGRKIASHTVGADGSLQYSLDDQPAGIYLIKTETTTIKIIKK